MTVERKKEDDSFQQDDVEALSARMEEVNKVDDDDEVSISEDSLGTSAQSSSDLEAKSSRKEATPEETIAKNETTVVRGLKLLVLVVLVIAMVTITVGVYLYTSRSEEQAFENSLSDYTTKIFASLGENIDLTLGAVDAFTVSMVSHARATNQTWPFVTIPDFAVRAAKIRGLSSATVMNLYSYVESEERAKWESYMATHGPQWVHDSIAVQERDENYKGPIIWEYENWNVIHANDEFDKENPGVNGTDREGPYLPIWQSYPVIPRYPVYGWDLFSDPSTTSIDGVLNTSQVTISEAYLIHVDGESEEKYESNELEADWLSDYIDPGEEPFEPVSDVYYPIMSYAADDTSNSNRPNTQASDIVAVLSLTVYWRDTLKNILPMGADGVDVVFENPCNPPFTYRINGPGVAYRGSGDMHETKYTHLGRATMLSDLQHHAIGSRTYTGIDFVKDLCPFTLTVYPSDTLRNYYTTNGPILFTVAAIIIFVFTSAVFIFYDCMVERRQKVVVSTAAKTSAIVSSLFPSNVRDSLIKEQEEKAALVEPPKRRIKTFVNSGDATHFNKGDSPPSGAGNSTILSSKPLAELYAECTVFFGDIAGFTSWSSARDPTEVFTLLEALYGAFDAVARRRGVFKVETIGDSYVAVCGLPDPRKNHAIVMAKFAADCRRKTNEVCQELELTLGPGTADLKLRIGLHSGSVTAGVLRGDKSRFQLFGDTVNTAARMESNGIPSRIQVSQKTADLLILAGKSHWLTAREDKVNAKGKGLLQCYWLEPTMSVASSETSTDIDLTTRDTDMSDRNADHDHLALRQTGKYDRLVKWNTAMFEELLKKVIAHQQVATGSSQRAPGENGKQSALNKIDSAVTVRDEVVEILALPEFDAKKASTSSLQYEDIELNENVKSQLHGFIHAIANTYRTNPFHNFEHASHVAMATKKLLQRVVTPDLCSRGSIRQKDLHDFTFGITSDPLTQFALAFVALVHDVDHPGVSNGQLVKEKAPMAVRYNNKSVAEQNSFDIAWNLLMDPCYDDLRNSICSTNDELKRFRQLVVNAIMATDIFDKDLKALRDSRWEKAFQECATDNSSAEDSNRKATIVIEHIIQASDVSHTCQHWASYQKWNRCLFEEMYMAYKSGRADTDPSKGWYKGELWFFDNYVIPLAKRLESCGVFGASSAELLDFARDNRLEWENKGQAIVAEMVEACNQQGGVSDARGALGNTADKTDTLESPAATLGSSEVHSAGLGLFTI